MKVDWKAAREAFCYTCKIFTYVSVIVMLLAYSHLESRVDRHESNFEDVDHRVTRLEQSQHCTDTALVKALQGVNESLYEIKLIKMYGNR